MLAGLIFIAAALYSSVGHAGASGYLAAMVLFGLTPEIMKPTALVLNILVATLTASLFYRAGLLDWRRLWPFLLGSIPLAFVGGHGGSRSSDRQGRSQETGRKHPVQGSSARGVARR